MRHRHPKKFNGFTLIELSLVLVIIGMLVGGIVVGQQMIRNAQVNKTFYSAQQYVAAANTFRSKYNCLPGDCATATQFWGRADGGADTSQNCAAPTTDINAANPLATCNGNGNLIIAQTPIATEGNTETYRFWQHLSNAGLVAGKFTGIGGAMGSSWRQATPGVNVPATAVSGDAGYFIYSGSSGSLCGAPTNYSGGDSGTRRTFFMIGGRQTGNPPQARFLTPAEAASIDAKFDDGRPGTGQLRGICAVGCGTAQNPDTSLYAVATNSLTCFFVLDTKFLN